MVHNLDQFAFASDNYSGIHPDILQAIANANGGHQKAYGNDIYTQKLGELIKELFGQNASCYPVFNGTGANITALTALSPRFGAIICTQTAHIHNDEINAPEYIGNFKILAIATSDGKLTPDLIQKELYRLGNEHAAQPAVIYLSLVSELGTCYSLDEICAIVALAKQYKLAVYIDGARLANACAYLDCSLKDIADTGVDILSLGGTKNGLMIGECIIVLNQKFDSDMKYLRKMTTQLGSKMRFISAQFITWLSSGLWLKLAAHSNQMANYFAQGLHTLANTIITQPVQSNAVFVILPKSIKSALQEKYHFYDWNVHTNEVRLMTSFDTTKNQIDEFLDTARALLNNVSATKNQL